MQPASTTNAIEVRGLEKRYGDVVALRGVDLDVARGSCFGLLGPNGAGKSTTLGVLTTLLSPSAGTARLLGHDVVRERAAVRSRIGVVFQEPALDPELTPREQLVFHARLFHLKGARARADERIERAGLGECADRPVRQLSGGLRRRVEIARGLLHRPGVLFLDEPTAGLDVAARADVWRELRKLREGGPEAETTIFLTTHAMEEADALCDEVAIVDAGRVVAMGTPEALKAALGGDVVTLVVERAEAARAVLASADGVRGVVAESSGTAPTRLRVTLADAPRRLPALLERVRDCGIVEVTMQRPSLEHVFLHHTGHRLERAAAEPR